MMAGLKASANRVASGYARLLEYFIPPAIAADREAANQARMFLISHSMGPILGNAVPLAVILFNPTLRPDAVVLAVFITMFWAFPFLLRWGANYQVLVLTSVVNLNFCILWSCYFYGGVASPTLPWLLIIPILSLFYVGGQRRLQPYLLTISGLAFVAFLAVYMAFPPQPIDMPVEAIHGLGIVSTAAALCYVATMAIYYARIFDAGIALEVEVRRRRKTTDALRKAVAEADRASAAKSEFLTRMSHELRTPLNAVIGYSQLLWEDAEADPDVRVDLDRIHGAGEYLLRLVNMILDLSKLEAGRMQFDAAPHAVATIVEETLAGRRQLIASRGNAVRLDFDPALGQVEVDAGRVKQVLDAILENAAQHTTDGTITVATHADAGGDPNRFSIAVADTGGGIEPAQISTLFETFTTATEAADGRYGGTGLNLSVVYRLCQAMGGTVEVESVVGTGSRFTIVLPVRPAADATEGGPVRQHIPLAA